jgi:hypothetical protein
MITLILVVSLANLLLQILACLQRHEALRIAKEKGDD